MVAGLAINWDRMKVEDDGILGGKALPPYLKRIASGVGLGLVEGECTTRVLTSPIPIPMIAHRHF
jgi:hypothetical protein